MSLEENKYDMEQTAIWLGNVAEVQHKLNLSKERVVTCWSEMPNVKY
jgi:hypothetical protein